MWTFPLDLRSMYSVMRTDIAIFMRVAIHNVKEVNRCPGVLSKTNGQPPCQNWGWCPKIDLKNGMILTVSIPWQVQSERNLESDFLTIRVPYCGQIWMRDKLGLKPRQLKTLKMTVHSSHRISPLLLVKCRFGAHDWIVSNTGVSKKYLKDSLVSMSNLTSFAEFPSALSVMWSNHSLSLLLSPQEPSSVICYIQTPRSWLKSFILS